MCVPGFSTPFSRRLPSSFSVHLHLRRNQPGHHQSRAPAIYKPGSMQKYVFSGLCTVKLHGYRCMRLASGCAEPGSNKATRSSTQPDPRIPTPDNSALVLFDNIPTDLRLTCYLQRFFHFKSVDAQTFGLRLVTSKMLLV